MANDNRPPRRVPTAARKYALGQEPSAEVLPDSTAEERLELVAVLTRRAWELMGKPWQTVPRSEWPLAVVKRR